MYGWFGKAADGLETSMSRHFLFRVDDSGRGHVELEELEHPIGSPTPGLPTQWILRAFSNDGEIMAQELTRQELLGMAWAILESLHRQGIE